MTSERIRDARRGSAFRDFLESEASGGLVLMAVAVLALIVANSPLSDGYFAVLKTYVFGLSVGHWINDALMALFFLFVGLEIKREMIDGQLSTWPRRALPGIAALGGMIAPALIFVAFNRADPATLRGWAIASATDIAFALGVLSLLGPRVPVSLKVFLSALAILDDLGAVLIIAVFYTSGLSPVMLTLSAVTVGLLFTLNRLGVRHLAPYLLLGIVLWIFVFKSGLHATLAGVALALTIPIEPSPGHVEPHDSPLHRLEHALQKPVAFLIVPIFGFANAGVSFAGVGLSAVLDPVPIGVAFGLFFGKQLGVFGFAWASIKAGLADRPAHSSWTELYGVSVLCGIGFTMSLFIGLLAYSNSVLLQDETKIGVLSGSLLSGVVGYVILHVATRGRGMQTPS